MQKKYLILIEKYNLIYESFGHFGKSWANNAKGYVPPGDFGRTGVNNAIDVALGTFEMIFTLMFYTNFFKRCLRNHQTGPVLCPLWIKKSCRIWVESLALHVYFICVGLNCVFAVATQRETNNMKLTCPTQCQRESAQPELYSTCSH